MKNLFTFFAAAFVGTLFSFAAENTYIDRIDPPYWWTDMHNPSLQLQIHGKNIRDLNFSIDSPGVSVDSVARLDGSPDWQFVYLNVGPDARPGCLTLKWDDGETSISRQFELRRRKPMKGARGFDASDVLYMIMPDRFADGNPDNNDGLSMNFPSKADRTRMGARHGGDLKGIADHLDYIDSLGITAVWLNPVLENDMPGGSYHGYSTTDYYRIDPRFGSNNKYAELVDSLHNRGIKSVMDMIFNHCGSEHPWALDPPASDWFNFQDGDGIRITNHKLTSVSDIYASDFDRDLCLKGWFVPSMPDLNQLNPHLMNYLIQNSIFWIEDAQIDGIRMDTYVYADRRQMKRWVEEVLDAYPDFNIVGECWIQDPAIEQFWQKGSPTARSMNMDSGLPSCMDFALFIKCNDMKPFREQTGDWGGGLNDIYSHLAADFIYADPMMVLRFLDNHDTDRFLPELPEDLAAWKQAQTLLLTIPGIPQIYYGTELLMNGKKLEDYGGDGNIRRDVPGGFPGDPVDQFTRVGRSPLQNEAYDFLSRLLSWRKSSPAIAKGKMKHFAPYEGLYLYERRFGDEAAVVVMNGRDEEIAVDMQRYAEIIPEDTPYTDILTGETLILRPSSGNIILPPRHTGIYIIPR